MMVADRSAPAFAARVSANTFAADVARTASQRRQAYRLRYDVYIAEQGKRYKEADHDERLFIDELDREAAILLVTQNGEAAGTVRANWFSSASVRRMYADSVQQQRFPRLTTTRRGSVRDSPSRPLAATSEHDRRCLRPFMRLLSRAVRSFALPPAHQSCCDCFADTASVNMLHRWQIPSLAHCIARYWYSMT